MPLLRELRERRPDWAVAISTTTDTGQRLARDRFPECAVFYLPLDFAILMRRTLRTLRPSLVVLMESELWPNMLRECERAGIPVVVANARLSDRSFGRAMRVPKLWAPVLARVTLFLAQGEETAGRLLRLGIPAQRVLLGGNLKYDLRPAPESPALERLRAALPSGSPLLVAGSTLGGEEALLLNAWAELRRAHPAAVMLLAPRHPERFDRVAEEVRQRGFGSLTMTEMQRDGAACIERGTVVVLDTIGDLAGAYGFAAVAFVGGSLVPAGGHNPLEPARFGVPVIMGPHFANFREIVERLLAAEAMLVTPSAGLVAAIGSLLSDGERAGTLGARGQAVFEQQAGAARRTVEALLPLVEDMQSR